MNIHLTGVSSLVEEEVEGKQRFKSFPSASHRFHITARDIQRNCYFGLNPSKHENLVENKWHFKRRLRCHCGLSFKIGLCDPGCQGPRLRDHSRHQKLHKYREVCANEGIDFYPLVFESLGGISSVAQSHLVKLCEAVAQANNSDGKEVTKHFFGRLSVLVWKGNAQLISSRFPSHAPPYVDGSQQLYIYFYRPSDPLGGHF